MTVHLEDHLGTFDDVADYRLDKTGAECLREFLQGSSFTPFLTTMDADRERVTRRAAEGTSKKELREKTENLSEAHLREWLEEQGDVDPADYADTKHPANAIPIADWVNIQTSLMPAAAAKGDVLPKALDALAK